MEDLHGAAEHVAAALEDPLQLPHGRLSPLHRVMRIRSNKLVMVESYLKHVFHDLNKYSQFKTYQMALQSNLGVIHNEKERRAYHLEGDDVACGRAHSQGEGVVGAQGRQHRGRRPDGDAERGLEARDRVQQDGVGEARQRARAVPLCGSSIGFRV